MRYLTAALLAGAACLSAPIAASAAPAKKDAKAEEKWSVDALKIAGQVQSLWANAMRLSRRENGIPSKEDMEAANDAIRNIFIVNAHMREEILSSIFVRAYVMRPDRQTASDMTAWLIKNTADMTIEYLQNIGVLGTVVDGQVHEATADLTVGQRIRFGAVWFQVVQQMEGRYESMGEVPKDKRADYQGKIHSLAMSGRLIDKSVKFVWEGEYLVAMARNKEGVLAKFGYIKDNPEMKEAVIRFAVPLDGNVHGVVNAQ